MDDTQVRSPFTAFHDLLDCQNLPVSHNDLIDYACFEDDRPAPSRALWLGPNTYAVFDMDIEDSQRQSDYWPDPVSNVPMIFSYKD